MFWKKGLWGVIIFALLVVVGRQVAADSTNANATPSETVTLTARVALQVATEPSSDFDGDGTVGMPDFLLFVDHYGTSRGDAGYDAKYDLDGNGAIGIPDFLIFVDNFGTQVPPSGGGGSVSDDHSNTRSGATSLSLGSSRSGQIETGSDVDFFRVQVSASGTLTVYTTGSLNTQGELQSSSGSVLKSDDDGGSGKNFSIERGVSPGTYYIKVESDGSDTGSYTVYASLGEMPPPSDDAITGSITTCSSTRNEVTGLVSVTIEGALQAHKQVSNILITGSANGQRVGEDFLNGIPAGQSQNFSISGTISTSVSSLTCSVVWKADVHGKNSQGAVNKR